MNAQKLAEAAVLEHRAIQKIPELAALIEELDGEQFVHVVEIGSQHGGTLWLWSCLADDYATIVGVDQAFQCPDDLEPRAHQHLTLFERDSHDPETVKMVKDSMGGVIDLLFLDGDHSYEGVKRDYELYSPMVYEGGMIIFHDIAKHSTPEQSEVDRFWRELWGDKWQVIWDNAVNIAGGVVLPAASCGIGIFRV